METKEMNAIAKIALINEHVANAMKLAADLRVEMDIITNSVCIMMIDIAEYRGACGDLDCLITLIGNLTGTLASEAIFNDVEKRMHANCAKLTDKQKQRLSKR